MSLRLIALDCPACGSAMAGAPQDMLYFCPHCGSGAILGEDGLETVESTALVAAPGRHPTTWRPAWLITADVVVDQRIRADGRHTEGSHGARTFVVPAFDLPLADLVEHSRALAENAAAAAEVPHEAIRGGTDGARLSYMGLLTPNVWAGGQNFHSVNEWVSLEWMRQAVEAILEILTVWVEKSVPAK